MRRPWFDSGSVHVGFMVEKVALGQVFLPLLRNSLVAINHFCSVLMFHLSIINAKFNVAVNLAIDSDIT
jgi:hypothetical protein